MVKNYDKVHCVPSKAQFPSFTIANSDLRQISLGCNFTAISEAPSKYGNSKDAFLFLIFRQSIKVAEEDCSRQGGNCVKHFISRLRKHNKDEKWEEKRKKEEGSWLISNTASSFSYTCCDFTGPEIFNNYAAFRKKILEIRRKNIYDFVWRYK